MNQKGYIYIILVVLVVVLAGVVGYLTLIKKPMSPAQQGGRQTSKDIIQCGSVSQKILTQYDYQPTETEKEAVIKSLTCINQALIKCSPSLLAINNTNQIMNITVKGQGKLGCNVSVQKFTGETMTCPLPSDYVAELQKKFTVSNYDASIVTDLITNINAEISSGNKSGNCTVTK